MAVIKCGKHVQPLKPVQIDKQKTRFKSLKEAIGNKNKIKSIKPDAKP